MNPGIGMLAALLATAAFLTAPPVPAQDAPSPTAIATRLLDRMNAGEYAQAESMFTAEMAKAVPAAKLKAVWESLPAQAGTAKGRGDPTVDTQGGTTLVTVPLPYEKTGLVAKVAVAADGRISGFLIQPAPPPAPAPPADDAGFSERDFGIGTGDRALPGTLAIPKGEPPSAGWPTVVLVHGSGPHDRDETIGPNRPFLDIARGLAAQGIAVLRYEKRTQARPQDFAERAYTIDDETTDDAVAAIAALRATEGVDPKRVFVFGHSQGGMLAPRIALKAGDVAGLVLFAAPARPLLDILIEQNVRMAVLGDGKTSDAERAAIERLKLQVQTARKDGDAAADALPMGLPASYWRSTDAVDPVVEAREAKLPMLVLQGARDIQVVDADWQRWRAGFHDDPKVAFKLYEKLNHLGIAGEGEGSLAEYGTPGQLDAQLIADVAGWIEAH
ncbi:alpha/beta fold hydrolase [Lysobacter sp. M15]|uniref:alpha/beta hydrolase n=1 Tax=Lysobacter sp. M15 TaxID=2916837 RepID=UPI001F5950D7|nr:alpha/beta fold hydrolase [Lysobacter sp. M15]